jgi:hypothetical protein
VTPGIFPEIPGTRSELKMMKKLGTIAFLALIIIPAGVIAAGVQGNGESGGGTAALAGSIQATALTSEEIAWLTYLREEEKLARDVYLYLYDEWNMHIFRNIAASEQKHTDAIKTLLLRYGITDPAADTARGEFTNPALQGLYDELILRGNTSQAEALNVGVFIEETDIDDLNTAIDSTMHKDITTVYTNLLRGSLNHLDAFESQLTK